MNSILKSSLAFTPLKFGYMARVKQQESLSLKDLNEKTRSLINDYSDGKSVHLGPRVNGDVSLSRELNVGYEESEPLINFRQALNAIVEVGILPPHIPNVLQNQAHLCGVESLDPVVEKIDLKTREAGQHDLAESLNTAYSQLLDFECPVVLEGAESAEIASNPFGVLMDLKPKRPGPFEFGMPSGSKPRGLLSSKDELWVISGQSDVAFVNAQKTTGKSSANIIKELKDEQLKRLA